MKANSSRSNLLTDTCLIGKLMGMIEDVRKHYFILAPSTTGRAGTHIEPLNRLGFSLGVNLSLFYLVRDVAYAAFYSLATLFTCFQYPDSREQLSRTLYACGVHLSAIPLGLIGMLFPQTVNEKLLKIPASGVTFPNSFLPSFLMM